MLKLVRVANCGTVSFEKRSALLEGLLRMLPIRGVRERERSENEREPNTPSSFVRKREARE